MSSVEFPKTIEIKIYRTTTVSAFCMGVKLGFLTLREERKLKIFSTVVLRRTVGPVRVEVRADWKKLQNAELHRLHSLPNIIWKTKSSRMRQAGHVAFMGTGEVLTGFWWGNLGKRNTLDDLDV